MRYFESHFEDYVQSWMRFNLHPEMSSLYKAMPARLQQVENLIVVGPAGVGKYTQVLALLQRYSPSHLKYQKRVTLSHEKCVYQYHISDIHYEIDMSLLGCNSKIIWHDLFQQIVDIISVKVDKIGVVVCKNFHLIHTELLEIFYSYMQEYNHQFSPVQVRFVIVTEHASFLPNHILNSCAIIRVQRPTTALYKAMLQSSHRPETATSYSHHSHNFPPAFSGFRLPSSTSSTTFSSQSGSGLGTTGFAATVSMAMAAGGHSQYYRGSGGAAAVSPQARGGGGGGMSYSHVRGGDGESINRRSISGNSNSSGATLSPVSIDELFVGQVTDMRPQDTAGSLSAEITLLEAFTNPRTQKPEGIMNLKELYAFAHHTSSSPSFDKQTRRLSRGHGEEEEEGEEEGEDDGEDGQCVDQLPPDIFNMVCESILEQMLHPARFSYVTFRDTLYDMFVYNLDIVECVWFILEQLVVHGHLRGAAVTHVLMEMYKFLKYFNNNYRPIYHVELIMFHMMRNFQSRPKSDDVHDDLRGAVDAVGF